MMNAKRSMTKTHARNARGEMLCVRWGVAAAAFAALVAMPGCELLVQFDRNLIAQDAGGAGGGAPDGTVVDTGADTGSPETDAPSADAPAVDAPADGDAGLPSDGSLDGAGDDAAPDVVDGGSSAPPDAAGDAAPEAGADVGTDVAANAADSADAPELGAADADDGG